MKDSSDQSQDLSLVPSSGKNAITKPTNGSSTQPKSDAAIFAEAGGSIVKGGFELGAAALNNKAAQNALEGEKVKLEAVKETGKTQVTLADMAAIEAQKKRDAEALQAEAERKLKLLSINNKHEIKAGDLAQRKLEAELKFKLEEQKVQAVLEIARAETAIKKIEAEARIAALPSPQAIPQLAYHQQMPNAYYPQQHQMLMPPPGNYYPQPQMQQPMLQQNGFAPTPQYPQQYPGSFHPQQHTPTQLLAQQGGFGMYAPPNPNSTTKSSSNVQALEFDASSLQFGSNH